MPRTRSDVARSPANPEESFYWEDGAAASATENEDWEELDPVQHARQQQAAAQRQTRRQDFQLKVLYAVTVAACFTSIALVIELQRQRGRAVEVAYAALQASPGPAQAQGVAPGIAVQPAVPVVNTPPAAVAPAAVDPAAVDPAAVAPAAVAPAAVDPAANAVAPAVAADPAAEQVVPEISVAAQAPALEVAPQEPAMNPARDERAPAADAPAVAKVGAGGPTSRPAVPAPATKASTPQTPKPLLGNTPAPVSPRQSPQGVAAFAGPSNATYRDNSPANASPVVTRAVRPATPSEKPPTRSFPAVN